MTEISEAAKARPRNPTGSAMTQGKFIHRTGVTKQAIVERLRQGPMPTDELIPEVSSFKALRVHIHLLRKRGYKIRHAYILEGEPE